MNKNRTERELLSRIRESGGNLRVEDHTLKYEGPALSADFRDGITREKFALILLLNREKESPPKVEVQSVTWDREAALDVLSEVCRRFAAASGLDYWDEQKAHMASSLTAGVGLLLLKRDPDLWGACSTIGVILDRWGRESRGSHTAEAAEGGVESDAGRHIDSGAPP